MKIGITVNSSKENVFETVLSLVSKLVENGISVFVCSSITKCTDFNHDKICSDLLVDEDKIYEVCDIILSIGGDGTMLNTAHKALKYSTPLLGVNFGKLGFLAEFDIEHIEGFVNDIKQQNYSIEDRLTLNASIFSLQDSDPYYAINDFVIDKGRWPKMIEITLFIDDEYVSSFSADGVIISTPTGSTGYSLSAGGPIVNPKTKAIVISPISPHTLTIRPLVISSGQIIRIQAKSQYKSIQFISDGQLINDFSTPVEFEIKASEFPLRLVHTKNTKYFDILRKKLFWGIDIRNGLKN